MEADHINFYLWACGTNLRGSLSRIAVTCLIAITDQHHQRIALGGFQILGDFWSEAPIGVMPFCAGLTPLIRPVGAARSSGPSGVSSSTSLQSLPLPCP
jgi:hypothetical protein